MIKTASVTEQGGRDYNEDSVGIVSSEGKALAILADGLGSCGGGKNASEAVVEIFSENAEELFRQDNDTFLSVFSKANEKVVSMQTKEVEMKSTAVVLVINQNKFMWGHVGDSRLYHFINGKLVFQTADHSVPQMKVSMGEITFDDIRSDPDRNRLLRAVGGDVNEIKATLGKPGKKGILQKHSFLLCSDGFWEYVLEADMEKTLKESDSPEKWLELMTAIIRGNAPEGNDNYSAIAIILQ